MAEVGRKKISNHQIKFKLLQVRNRIFQATLS